MTITKAKRQRGHAGWRYCVTGGVLQLLCAGSVNAGTIDFADGSTVEYLLNLTYSAAMRVDDASDRLEANINGDDGNRNFDAGSLINNRVAALGEFRYERNMMGVFLRGSAFYDDAVAGSDPDHDAPGRRNRSSNPDRFSDAMESLLGRRARVLDAYAYGTWRVAGTSLSVRAGEQVVSWGESLFFPNTSGAQSPADATSSNVPGTEVKEVLLPVGQVYVQWGLTSRLGLSGYVQYENDYTELNPVGAYFSTSDTVGPGAEFLLVEFPQVGTLQVPRGADIKPADGRQWGVSAKYLFGLGTEVAVQYLRYHDPNPTGVVFNNPGPADIVGGNSSYQILYTPDVRLASISMNTDIAGTAWTAEVSRRWDAGVSVNAPALAGAPAPTPTTGDVWQANLGAFHIFLPTALWDQLVVLGEVSSVHVSEVDPVRAGGQDFDELSRSKHAAAFQGQMVLTYLQVLPGWDLGVTLAHANAFEGNTSLNASLGSLTGQGDRRYRLGFGFTYLANLQFEVAYNHFDGSPEPNRRGLADRSFASFSAKYSF